MLLQIVFILAILTLTNSEDYVNKTAEKIEFATECEKLMSNRSYFSPIDAETWLLSHGKFPLTHFVGDSSIRIKHDWIANHPNFHWLTKLTSQWFNDCDFIEKEIAAVTKNHYFRESVKAVIWNLGLHTLQALPSVPYHIENIHNYKHNITTCAKYINNLYPNAKKYFVLTNHICEDKLWDEIKESLKLWENDKNELDDLYFMQFSNIGVTVLNEAAIELRHYNHTILPSFTVNACDCTMDGRHYRELDPHFLVNFIKTFYDYDDAVFSEADTSLIEK